LSTVAPIFRIVCRPASLDGTPPGWVAATLRDGDVALLVDDGGLEAIDAAARALDQVTVSILRREPTAAEQEGTVITYAGSLPLIWVAPEFTESVQDWAHDRGPMTLLIEAGGALPDAERARIGRFVALLARQTE
jgi:hypothetical protein